MFLGMRTSWSESWTFFSWKRSCACYSSDENLLRRKIPIFCFSLLLGVLLEVNYLIIRVMRFNLLDIFKNMKNMEFLFMPLLCKMNLEDIILKRLILDLVILLVIGLESKKRDFILAKKEIKKLSPDARIQLKKDSWKQQD